MKIIAITFFVACVSFSYIYSSASVASTRANFERCYVWLPLNKTPTQKQRDVSKHIYDLIYKNLLAVNHPQGHALQHYGVWDAISISAASDCDKFLERVYAVLNGKARKVDWSNLRSTSKELEATNWDVRPNVYTYPNSIETIEATFARISEGQYSQESCIFYIQFSNQNPESELPVSWPYLVLSGATKNGLPVLTALAVSPSHEKRIIIAFFDQCEYGQKMTEDIAAYMLDGFDQAFEFEVGLSGDNLQSLSSK